MKKHKDEDSVSYRHLEIPTKNGVINGFALWYESEKQAIQGFKKIHEYIDAMGKADCSFNIEFNKTQKGTYNLSIIINTDLNIYGIEIQEIESVYVKKLIEGLKEFQFYFITAGYEDKLLPISEYNYFRKSIYVDGEIIVGRNKNRWPYELFESNTIELSNNKK